VIVPVYNDERYLEDCLVSLRDQSRAPAEIIVVDNASTDGSVGVAESVRLPNLRVIRLPENLGATAARNVALDATVQPYAVFVDSDDFLSLDALESAHRQLTESDCDVALFELVKTSADGQEVLFKVQSPRQPMTGQEALAMTMPTWRLQTLGMYRRAVIDRARTRFSYHGFSDDEFFSRLLFAEANCVTGSHGTYYYRANPKPYTFSKVLGQTETHIRSARLAEERLGRSYGGGTAARNMISRNLIGLVARAARGEGNFQEIARLCTEARALTSKRRPWHAHWRLADAITAAVSRLATGLRADQEAGASKSGPARNRAA
jgi:glycosyltransferase involved in cell wall biosynthesis